MSYEQNTDTIFFQVVVVHVLQWERKCLDYISMFTHSYFKGIF